MSINLIELKPRNMLKLQDSRGATHRKDLKMHHQQRWEWHVNASHIFKQENKESYHDMMPAKNSKLIISMPETSFSRTMWITGIYTTNKWRVLLIKSVKNNNLQPWENDQITWGPSSTFIKAAESGESNTVETIRTSKYENKKKSTMGRCRWTRNHFDALIFHLLPFFFPFFSFSYLYPSRFSFG